MKKYFYLQFKLTNRRIREAGIHPLPGFLLAGILIVAIAEYGFQKFLHTGYLLVLVVLSLQLKLSERKRSDFIRSVFGDLLATQIRIIENLIIGLPFLLVLLYKGAYLEAILQLGISVILAVIPVRLDLNISVPTPFSKRPFEFSTGFRKSFLVYLLAYSLAIIALASSNLNLGIFSLLLIFLTASSYYTKPEQDFYIWIFAKSPSAFLRLKVLDSLRNASLLSSPIILSLLLAYPQDFGLLIVFFVMGILFMWSVILAKYSAYPREMNLPEGVLIALCVFFPPALLAVLPLFYGKANIKLKPLLDDTHTRSE